MRRGNSDQGRAIKWATASNLAGEGLSVLTTLILAALLSPQEFGIVAIAYLYIVFIELLVGFGFNTALIQRQDLQASHLNSVFWLNVVAGLMLAGIAILLAGWWARVNEAPLLKPLIISLSVMIPLQGLSIVQTALLQRNMQFKELAIRNTASLFAGGIAGVGMALAGFGTWSLVAQHVIRSLVSTVSLWKVSEWRPSFSFDFRQIKSLSGYSNKVFLGQIGVFFQNQTESIIMGVCFGPLAVGYYRFTDRLVEMALKLFPRAVQIVSLTHFSKQQKDLKLLNESFIKNCHLLCLVTVPVLALMAGASSSILQVVSAKWLPAAPVLQILVIVGLCKVLVLLVGPLLQALSRPGVLTVNVWSFAVINALGVYGVSRVLATSLAEEQAMGVALVRSTIFAGVYTPMLLWQARNASGVSLLELAKVVSPCLLAGGIAALLIRGLQEYAKPIAAENNILFLLPFLVFAFASWFILLRVLDRRGFNLFIGLLEKFVRKKRWKNTSQDITKLKHTKTLN